MVGALNIHVSVKWYKLDVYTMNIVCCKKKKKTDRPPLGKLETHEKQHYIFYEHIPIQGHVSKSLEQVSMGRKWEQEFNDKEEKNLKSALYRPVMTVCHILKGTINATFCTWSPENIF